MTQTPSPPPPHDSGLRNPGIRQLPSPPPLPYTPRCNRCNPNTPPIVPYNPPCNPSHYIPYGSHTPPVPPMDPYSAPYTPYSPPAPPSEHPWAGAWLPAAIRARRPRRRHLRDDDDDDNGAATTTCPGRGWGRAEGGPGGVTPSPPRHFTFEPPVGPSGTPRPRRRHRRVLYPPAVRRPLPTEEPSAAKRLLVLLLAVVSAQVYSAPGRCHPRHPRCHPR
ncbi:radiation-inducible immediate-early gene IEX-1 [Strix aluco]|uniref:radiation-inducible immediate-early gene IEX-1 n=1 Tax=Strix aluco TaxID=111821 RepID=UPI003DA6B35F